MKIINKIFISLLLCLCSIASYGQSNRTIRGKVLSSFNKPIKDAIIAAQGSDEIKTTEDGTFTLELKSDASSLSIWAPGYFPVNRVIKDNTDLTIIMVSENQYKYNESAVLPQRIENERIAHTAATNITKKDFNPGSIMIDRALSGQIAGLKTTRMGGMPGEGTYMNLRGIRSLTADNAPLIVINGMPHLPDSKESSLINGYTRNIFQTYNIGDIQNITVLKGAEAALYGSLGANGVILIETDGAASDDLETKISFYGQYGMSWNKKRMPLLAGKEYTSYLSDIGMTYYNNMGELFNEFPFLNNPDNKYNYLYNNNTDWQKEIYQNAFTTDNLFRIEGGDAIAKYDLSLGYLLEDGLLKETSFQRYHTQLNTNILVSKQVELIASVGLSYINGEYQEQGMVNQTNPILTAYAKSPLLSPWKKDTQGQTLNEYADFYYGISNNMNFAVSNPLAVINSVDVTNRQYDVNALAGITYKVLQNLSLSGKVGLYYNYNNEKLFVPGKTDKTIIPLFTPFGEAENTVKNGVGKVVNFFYNINGQYHTVLDNKHKINVLGGLQSIISEYEYDAGVGYNTANDFYQTLNNVNKLGRNFSGYISKWNWMNFYAHGDYTYSDMLKASLNMSVDGASSTGVDADRFYIYPSLGLTWFGKSLMPLSNSTFVNRLNVRAEYSITGNSRFSSNFGKHYYQSSPYQKVAGIVRMNVPNTKLKQEQNALLNLGLDMSFLFNRIELSFDYYNNQTSDAIFATPQSSVYGTGLYYDNLGKLSNQGVELAIQASIIRTPDFEWVIGGNIAKNRNKIKSLGGEEELIHKYADGAQLITKKGRSPYEFYGYETKGVFSTQQEAQNTNLRNDKGSTFTAGDIHFVDQNGDHVIDEKDRVSLGSAEAKFFGGFFTSFRYKHFSLSAEFTYSKGNKAYNAVRRNLESLSSFDNQSIATINRWKLEGQVTDMPRAEWGDPIGNNDFSDRWIEDASYLRMKNITFSYDFNRKVLNLFRSGTIYITGENLFTVTKYLGLDPEFAYSYNDAIQGFDYAKLMSPRRVKFGVNLKF